MMDSAINGVLQSLDPYSAYMSPELFKEMQTDTRGEFGGLGIRYGFKTKRWGYICWSGSGVHIEVMKGAKQKRYVFSCSDPEACIAALNLSPEQTISPEPEA